VSRARRSRGSFREGFGFGLIGFVSSAVIALATSIATARLYGIDVVGEFALAYAPTGAAWFLSSIREAPVLMKRIAPLEPRDPLVTGLFAAVFAFSTALTAAVVALGIGVSWFAYNGPLDQPDLFVPAVANLVGYLVIVNPAWNLDTIFSAFRAGQDLFWVRLHQALAYLALVAVLRPLAGSTIWALIAALYASWLTALVHRLLLMPAWMRLRAGREAMRAGRAELRPIVVFGLKLAPGSMAYGLSHEVGVWVLGARGSVAQVGAYSRAWMVAGRLLDFNYRLTEMLLPTLAQRHSTDDRSGFDRALVDSMRYLALGLMLPAAVGAGAAEGIMELFGPGFERAAGALAFLLLVPLVTTLTQLQVSALIALDRPAITTAFGLVRLGLTIVATAVLVEVAGITGAALGLLAGATAQLVLQSLATRRHLSSPLRELWPLRTMAALVVAYVLSFAAARLGDGALGGVGGTVAALAAGTLVYAAAALGLRALLPRDRRLLRELIARRRRR
jgi:O-antigen/teichoic acid export membrane protein